MKKIIIGYWLVVLAVMAVSCAKEGAGDSPAAGGGNYVELKAQLEKSKASVTSAGVVSWTSGDQIGVFTTSGNIRTFDMVSMSGSSATFAASLDAGEAPSSLAVFPASSFKGLSWGHATISYPATYTYADGAMNAPMYATVGDGALSFRHLGGMIQVVCNPVPDAATAFHLVCKDMQIVGNFSATVEAPMTVSSVSSSSNTKCKVTFAASEGSVKTFNVPVPCGEYESVYAYFTDAAGNKIREWRVLENVTVEAGDMYRRTMPDLMRVMSYNLLYDNPDASNESTHPWATERLGNAVSALPSRYYDLWGAQESTTNQIANLQDALSGYEVCGTSHGGYSLSEIGRTSRHSVTAIFRKSGITLLDSGTFWYSDNPSSSSRKTNFFKDKNGAYVTPSLLACNWAKLRYNGKVFYHFNVHLQVNDDKLTTDYDPVYQQIRLYQWSILKPRIKAVAGDYPVILTGDFNNTASDEGDIIQTILADTDLNMVDAYSATRQPHGSTGTLHYFRTTATTRRIDFVFVNNKFKVESYRVDASQQSTPLWESDHLPVLVDLSFVE